MSETDNNFQCICNVEIVTSSLLLPSLSAIHPHIENYSKTSRRYTSNVSAKNLVKIPAITVIYLIFKRYDLNSVLPQVAYLYSPLWRSALLSICLWSASVWWSSFLSRFLICQRLLWQFWLYVNHGHGQMIVIILLLWIDTFLLILE